MLDLLAMEAIVIYRYYSWDNELRIEKSNK